MNPLKIILAIAFIAVLCFSIYGLYFSSPDPQANEDYNTGDSSMEIVEVTQTPLESSDIERYSYYKDIWQNNEKVLILDLYGKSPGEYIVELSLQEAIELNKKGIDFGNNGNSEEAVEVFDKATILNPAYANAWNNKGIALGNLQRHEEAVSAFKKTIELSPGYANAWNNKGIALGNLQRHEEAIEAFNKSIELNPEYAHAWNNMGIALVKLKRFADAKNALEKAHELDPKYTVPVTP
ncbi:MAG: tetratricopeptide repeat protein [Candidatus Aenigmarchaeota archaeon]|nr:tetratricopeptide repeat protein [Candidatus Aenigmarchaeota archaeon]